jgi:proteic killer suppression protein
MAIQGIRHKGLKRLFEDDDARALPASLVGKLRDMLAAIDTASTVEEIALFPGLEIAPPKGRPRRPLESHRHRKLVPRLSF